MIDLRKNVWTAVAAVTAVQLAVLGYMVWSRVHLLKHGREITVDVVPVDPRDIFRGDYVVLGYPFSAAGGLGNTNVTLPDGVHEGSAVYMTLSQGEGGTWSMARLDRTYPATVASQDIVLKGHVERLWGDHTSRVRYGIESYFVPEGTGTEIEKLVRDKKVRAVIAVASDGTAALKALEAGGKRLQEQQGL